MSILGVIVRGRPGDTAALRERLSQRGGVAIALDPHDGRLILVMEDTPEWAAAQSLADIALWPTVLNTSLVYEYSGPDLADQAAALSAYADWRDPPRSRTTHHGPDASATSGGLTTGLRGAAQPSN